jgi:hypothetical protein
MAWELPVSPTCQPNGSASTRCSVRHGRLWLLQSRVIPMICSKIPYAAALLRGKADWREQFPVRPFQFPVLLGKIPCSTEEIFA